MNWWNSLQRHYVPLISVGVCLILVLQIPSTLGRGAAAQAFYEQALQDSGVATDIYTLIQKTSGVPKKDTLHTDRLAYQILLARREPVLGLPGVDTRELRAHVDSLEQVVDTLADLQSDSKDAQSVRTALYPTTFLRALADAEDARRTFLQKPTDDTAYTYRMALREATYAGADDAATFSAAFSKYLPSKDFRFSGLGLSITSGTLLAAANNLSVRMEEVRALLQARERCVAGYIDACGPTPTLEAFMTKSVPSTTPVVSLSLTREIQDLIHEAYGGVRSSGTIEVLQESTCLSKLPSPYTFFVLDRSYDSPVPFRFMGNFIFIKTDAGSTSQYMRDKLGITYSRFDPMVFYNCPDLGESLSSVLFIRAIANFAHTHPDVAPTARAIVVQSEAVTDSQAITYLQEALRTTTNSTTYDELESLKLMYQGKTAGLDGLVRAISNILATDGRIYHSGVPFDLSAKNLFLTHSAFPSLFLTDSPLFGTTLSPIRSDEEDTNGSFLSTHAILYSDIRTTVPRSKIIHDLQKFAQFEETLP